MANMITEQQINDLLIKGRKLADMWEAQGKHALSLQAIQVTSRIALEYLPKAEKVICGCGKQLRIGLEVEFYNHTGSCYSCEAAYSDALENI